MSGMLAFNADWPEIMRSTTADRDRIVNTIVLGFSTDPTCRWLYPEPEQFLTHFPTLVRLFGGRAFVHNAAYHTDDYLGGALWLPPGVHPDEDGLTALFQENFAGAMRDDVFSLFEQMDRYHPDEPCWHLAFIAVDPVRQGNGYGAQLLKHTLALCDADRKLAYLESSNPANLSLYRRHGFEQIGTIQAGSSPPLFPMVREPR